MRAWILPPLLTLAVAIVFYGACGKATDTDSSSADTSTADATEVAVTAVGGSADEASSESFGALSSHRWYAELFIPNAWGASCTLDGRAASKTCSSSKKTVTYSGCGIGSSLFTLSGTVELDFTGTAGCAFSNTGDTVTRLPDTTVTGPRGGTLKNFYTSHTDFRGNTISGGTRLTRTSSSSFNLTVLGTTKTLSTTTKSIFDISLRTTSDILVGGALARAGRTMTGGSLEVIHNLAQFVATYVPSNMTWSSSCCYPTSGSMAVTYTGTKTGTSTVTFTGCGTATVTSGNASTTVSFTSCE